MYIDYDFLSHLIININIVYYFFNKINFSFIVHK